MEFKEPHEIRAARLARAQKEERLGKAIFGVGCLVYGVVIGFWLLFWGLVIKILWGLAF